VPRKRPPPTVQIGNGGLRHFAGRVDEEFHPRLRGTKAMRVYEEMSSNDATVGAVLYVVEAFLRRVEWKVEPADESEAAEAEAEFLRSCMADMVCPWEDFVSDALSFLPYGFAAHEIVYKIRRGRNGTSPRFLSDFDDGRIGWQDLALRPQTTIDKWDIDTSGQVLGAVQKDPNTQAEVYIPANRMVLFRTRPFKGNPEGRSILRTAYRSWYMKKRLEEVEAIGVSRDLTGIPLVELPVQLMSPRATPDQVAVRQAMERLVSQIHRDEREGFVFPAELDADGKPTGYKLRLLSSPGQKQVPADPVIRRYDTRILMSMAAEFLMLGTEKQGSFALGASKSENFVKSLEWYVNIIAQTLNKTAVTRLFEANAVPVELRPRVVPGDLDKPSLSELGLFLSQAAAGKFLHPTPALEARIREVADLPIEEEDLEQLFEEEKALEAEQRELDAEVARAGAQAAAALPGAKPAPPGAKPAAKPAPKKEKE
jgi:hypothetical protein